MDDASKGLKLLHVASGDLWAGAEVQVFYLCRQLYKKGFDVSVVLFNQGVLADRLMAEGVPVTIFDETKLGGFELLRRFGVYLRRAKPMLIHTHGHKENVLVGMANALTIRAICVRTTHGANEINEPFWKAHKHFFHWLDRFAARHWQKAIVAVSYPLADLLSKTFPATPIHVIENAIDIDYVERIAAVEASAVVSPSTFNIAVIGRLVPVKRQDLLLRAVPLLTDYPQIHLFIIGDGPLNRELMKLAAQLQISEKVTFTGALDPIYPVLARVNLLAMPSDHEGLPMTLLEAMTLKVPVVAHAVGGVVTVTRQGQLANLVDDHSPQGYAEAIRAVLANIEVAKARASVAAEYVKQHYDIEKKSVEYRTLYKELLLQKA